VQKSPPRGPRATIPASSLKPRASSRILLGVRRALPAFLALLLSTPLFAQEARPLNNTSYVPVDDDRVTQLIEEAKGAAKRLDRDTVAELLQRVLLLKSDAVVSLRERELYTSPRRWAQWALLAERKPFTRAVLDAWRAAHDAEAKAALFGAIASGDESAILRLLDQYPAATAAPLALLALFDAAVLRADIDAARGYLLRVPEHLARSEADAFLKSEQFTMRAAFLRERREPAPNGWPTVGGSAARSRNGDALPSLDRLSFLWASTPLLERELALVDFDQPKRASLSLPFYPICDEQNLYIHLGTDVAILSRESGRMSSFAPIADASPDPTSIETMMLANPGLRGATIDNGILYFARLRSRRNDDGDLEFRPWNELVAFDVAARQRLWTRSVQRPRSNDPEILLKPLFFRGAPAVVGRHLFVYGAMREQGDSGPTRKESGYLFCFDKRSGDLVWHRFLGYAETEVDPRLPPISGHAPAVSQGVVVCVTGLGVAAALDARSGEVLWMLRYNRRPMPKHQRLKVVRAEWAPRRPAWKREAPRIHDDYVLMAPIDSDGMDRCWLRGRRRPQDGTFTLVCWSQRRDKDHGRNCLLEYIAGLHEGRGYYAGVRDPDRERWGYQNVISNDLDREFPFRYARLPATVRDPDRGVRVPPRLFGRPTIAGDVLLLPTRKSLYAFSLARPDSERDGSSDEIPPLGRFDAPELEHAERDGPPPMFGNLLSIGGHLYAVTRDRVLCYGKKK